MSRVVEELINEEIYERNIRLTDKLLKSGHSLQEVADYLEISIDEVKELSEMQTV